MRVTLISETLSNQGLSAADVLAVHLYVKNMDHFARINQVYKTYFGLNPPIRYAPQIHSNSYQALCFRHKGSTNNIVRIFIGTGTENYLIHVF